jgi:hypothetical protein
MNTLYQKICLIENIFNEKNKFQSKLNLFYAQLDNFNVSSHLYYILKYIT